MLVFIGAFGGGAPLSVSAQASVAAPAVAKTQRVFAQQPRILPGVAATRPQTPATPSLAAALGSSPWTALGPQPILGLSTYGPTSGRVTALASNGPTVYAGGADGGVWKSSDSGTTWTPLTDTMATLAVGALAIDPTNAATVYVGTGEGNLCQDCLPSQGISKTTDGGTTWTPLINLTTGTYYINTLVVDTTNTQRLFAATSTGLYESDDGAVTWKLDRAGNINTVAQGLSDPSDFWTAETTPCSAPTYGAIGFWSTTSNTWTSRWGGPSPTPPLPVHAIRIGLGIGKNQGPSPITAYASIAACPEGTTQLGQLVGILKTTDGGTTWSLTPPSATLPDYFASGSPPVAWQGWYDNVVAVDPTDPTGASAMFGGVTLLSTTTGGATFTDVAKPYLNGPLHPDFHAIAFTGPSTLYAGNDGGVWSTTDLGGAGTATDWTNLNTGLGITQFYSGSALDLNHVVGGAQDEGTAGILPSGPPLPAWKSVLIGDGTGSAQIPGSSILFASNPGLDIFQVDGTTGGMTEVAPCSAPYNPNTNPICKDPAGFIAPFVIDPTATSSATARLYGGTNRVYMTTNGGGTTGGQANWTAISPDLTTDTGTAPNLHVADWINAMSLGAGSTSGTLLVGSWFGKVWLATSAPTATPLAGWVDVTGNLPAFNLSQESSNAWITSVAINPLNNMEAWVTIGTLTGNRVWHTTNAGALPTTTWTDISATLPASLVVASIAVDPIQPQTVYLGTDAGAMACTTCGGATVTPSWVPLGTGGLPNVRVDAISFTGNDNYLVAWTHGRGAWYLPRPFPTAGATLSPPSWNFGNQNLSEASASETFTLTSSGTGPLTVSSIAAGSDFAIAGIGPPCNGTPPFVLAPTTSCAIGVTFTPSQLGARTGSLTVADNATDSPQIALLSGTGVVQWETLGGYLTSAPAASSYGGNRTDVFARGGDNAVWYRTLNGSVWGNWASLGGGITAEPAAVSWGPSRIDLFVRGTDKGLWHRSFDGTTWSNWENLGGILNSGAAASSTGSGELDVFALGGDNAVWHRTFASGAWGAWESLSGLSGAAPAAMSPAAGQTDIFVRGLDNAMWHRTLANPAWQSLGGGFNSGPAVSSWGSGRLDLFGVGKDNALWHSAYGGTSWSAWASLSGQSNANPGAVARSVGLIDLFVRGTDFAIWHITSTGS